MRFKEELKRVEEILDLHGRKESPEEYAYRLSELCTLAEELKVPQLCEYGRGLFEQWIREGKSEGYIMGKLREWSRLLSDKAQLLREMTQEDKKLISSFDELRQLEVPPITLSVMYATVIRKGNFGRLYLKVDNNSAFRALVTGISFDGGVKLALPLGFVEVMPHSSASIEREVLVEGDPGRVEIMFQQGGTVRRIDGKVAVKAKVAVSYKEYLGSPVEALKRVEKVERCGRLTIRERFGEWEAYCLLGEGGYGVTYLARRRDEIAVVKVAKENPDSKRAIEREYEILSRARDFPGNVKVHVAEIIEHGINAKGLPYIVLKYYPRGNLLNMAGRLSPRDALIILLQIGGTLIEFYRRGILRKHGDLKPENILIDEEGRPVIIDFGTALEAGRITDRWGRGTTSGYGCHAEDSRADVYALGRLLVDMLVGIKAREEDVPYPLDKLVKAARKKRGESCDPEGVLKMEEFIKMAEDLLPLL